MLKQLLTFFFDKDSRADSDVILGLQYLLACGVLYTDL